MSINKIQPDTRLPKEPRIKIYAALISQTGTNAPTVTVLQNSLTGPIVWTRTGIGIYVGTLIGEFTANKTSVIMGQENGGISMNRTDNDKIGIQTFDNTFANSDNILFECAIEIKVYDI